MLTGAPGCGKTTVAAALGQRGYVVVAEAATDVIARQQARGVDKPWEREDFLDQVVALQRQRQLDAGDNGTLQIFDRSPLCSLALARYLQRPVSRILTDEIARVVKDKVFEQDVFLLRPLGFVTATAARRISYADSLEFERIHEATYREHGFSLVDIASGDVPARATAIETHIQSAGLGGSSRPLPVRQGTPQRSPTWHPRIRRSRLQMSQDPGDAHQGAFRVGEMPDEKATR